jgi:hypothetical protein
VSRVAISLDPHALTELRNRAQTNKEPVARTAARLVRDGLLSSQAAGILATAATEHIEPQNTTLRPAWIEPDTDPQQWRRQLWAAVTALHERYPEALGRLPGDWWTSRALTETLAALSQWRAQLDTGQQTDPRAELLFHDRLEILQRQLTQTTDPTGQRFTGGTPPTTWVAGADDIAALRS